MTPQQENDCMAFLAQRASVKVAAELAGVSEWDVVSLIGYCRRQRSDRKPRPAHAPHQILEAAE